MESHVLEKLRREPLFHFLGLAALLFIAQALFSGDSREIITVDPATRDYLVQQRQELVLRELNETEKKEVIDAYIEEEILVREARKRGFENSSRIRTLLIQNMRFFMASEIASPTEKDLRDYFDENLERFTSQPSASYEHAFFIDPADVPDDALELLRNGADYRAMGDTTAMNARIIAAGEDQIVMTFGREQAPGVLTINDPLWHGPFASQNGTHFLRLYERKPAVPPIFEQSKNWLEQEWILQKSREAIDRELKLISQNYRIERTSGEDSN